MSSENTQSTPVVSWPVLRNAAGWAMGLWRSGPRTLSVLSVSRHLLLDEADQASRVAQSMGIDGADVHVVPHGEFFSMQLSAPSLIDLGKWINAMYPDSPRVQLTPQDVALPSPDLLWHPSPIVRRMPSAPSVVQLHGGSPLSDFMMASEDSIDDLRDVAPESIWIPQSRVDLDRLSRRGAQMFNARLVESPWTFSLEKIGVARSLVLRSAAFGPAGSVSKGTGDTSPEELQQWVFRTLGQPVRPGVDSTQRSSAIVSVALAEMSALTRSAEIQRSAAQSVLALSLSSRGARMEALDLVSSDAQDARRIHGFLPPDGVSAVESSIRDMAGQEPLLKEAADSAIAEIGRSKESSTFDADRIVDEWSQMVPRDDIGNDVIDGNGRVLHHLVQCAELMMHPNPVGSRREDYAFYDRVLPFMLNHEHHALWIQRQNWEQRQTEVAREEKQSVAFSAKPARRGAKGSAQAIDDFGAVIPFARKHILGPTTGLRDILKMTDAAIGGGTGGGTSHSRAKVWPSLSIVDAILSSRDPQTGIIDPSKLWVSAFRIAAQRAFPATYSALLRAGAARHAVSSTTEGVRLYLALAAAWRDSVMSIDSLYAITQLHRTEDDEIRARNTNERISFYDEAENWVKQVKHRVIRDVMAESDEPLNAYVVEDKLNKLIPQKIDGAWLSEIDHVLRVAFPVAGLDARKTDLMIARLESDAATPEQIVRQERWKSDAQAFYLRIKNRLRIAHGHVPESTSSDLVNVESIKAALSWMSSWGRREIKEVAKALAELAKERAASLEQGATTQSTSGSEATRSDAISRLNTISERAEALAQSASLDDSALGDGAKGKKQKKQGKLDKGIAFVERVAAGPQRDGDVDPESMLRDHGLKGGQWGNWIALKDRQAWVNMTADSLSDMTRVLGFPQHAGGLFSELSIAWGARGNGGKAAAHYEPFNQAINLTRDAGAGSLMHEYAHALDNWLWRQSGRSSVALSPYISYVAKDRLTSIRASSIDPMSMAAHAGAADEFSRVATSMRNFFQALDNPLPLSDSVRDILAKRVWQGSGSGSSEKRFKTAAESSLREILADIERNSPDSLIPEVSRDGASLVSQFISQYVNRPIVSTLSQQTCLRASVDMLPSVQLPKEKLAKEWPPQDAMKQWAGHYFDAVLRPGLACVLNESALPSARDRFLSSCAEDKSRWSNHVRAHIKFAAVNYGWASRQGSEFLWRAEHEKSMGGPGYWANPTELFARASETLMWDTLQKAGLKNTMLVSEEERPMWIPECDRDRLLPLIRDVYLSISAYIQKAQPALEASHAAIQASVAPQEATDERTTDPDGDGVAQLETLLESRTG